MTAFCAQQLTTTSVLEYDTWGQRYTTDMSRDMEANDYPVEQLDVVITAEDDLLPIGSITSVLGNMIVIQVGRWP